MKFMKEYLNCSFCVDCKSVSIFEENSYSEYVIIKLAEFIFVSCIVMVFHVLDVLINNKFKWKGLELSSTIFDSQRIAHIILLSCLILTLPFITILITGALVYKLLCSIVIKRKDRRFVQFLDSYDVFHCLASNGLEDKNTTDIEGIIQSNTIELAVENIKAKLNKVFSNYGTEKIFYRRNEEYGFYYWRRYSFIDLAKYVQIVEIPENSDINVITPHFSNKNDITSEIDEGLFKVLIKKNSTKNIDVNAEYKITIKFHQSVNNRALVEFVARLVETSDDCQVMLHSTPQMHEDDSPDSIINMITKLCNILARSLEDTKKNQNITIQRLKTLEWTKSDENLRCKVKDMCDFNLSNVLQESLARILNNLER